MTQTNNNNDLVWDLAAFNQRQRAIDFVMGFENKLCVFSNSVEQLYLESHSVLEKNDIEKIIRMRLANLG